MLDALTLRRLYEDKRKSVQEIADIFGCSPHKISYWIKKYNILTRSHSEATYAKRNPHGDPFSFRLPVSTKEGQLFGLGLGLYWGEGNKANKNSIRLGNTDPAIIRSFIQFLFIFFNIKMMDLKFGLQIFSDIDPELALDFWVKQLNILRSQINKPVVTRSGAVGTYRKKNQTGVLTVMYHNKKARDLLISLLPL